MRRNLTIRVWLDDRTTSKKHGGHPVKLVVTWHKVPYMKSLRSQLFLTPREFTRRKNEWQEIEVRARAVAKQMPDFSPDAFFEKFFGVKGDELRLSHWVEYKAQECKTPRNADRYRNAFKFIQNVSGKNDPYLADVTKKALERWTEKALTLPIAKGGKPYSRTSVHIHLSAISTVFNIAVEKDAISKNPFKLFTIPSGRKTPDVKNHVRRSLTPHELSALWQYRPENDRERWALDLWKFSYLTGGMPLVDMAGLTTENIRGGAIEYRRKKTENTTEETRIIMIPIMPDVEPLLYRYQEGRYLFGIYADGMDDADRARVLNTKQTYLGRVYRDISEKINIPRFTFDSARHTASAMLQRAGITPEQVARIAGNSAGIVRKHYTPQADLDERRDILERLRPGESK